MSDTGVKHGQVILHKITGRNDGIEEVSACSVPVLQVIASEVLASGCNLGVARIGALLQAVDVVNGVLRRELGIFPRHWQY